MRQVASSTGLQEPENRSVAPASGAAAGVQGWTPEPRTPQASIDLKECASSYPAYLAYLNRTFGNRTADPAGILQRDRMTDGDFRLLLLPNGSVVFELVRRGLQMGTDKMQKLVAYMNGILFRHGDVLRSPLQKVGGKVRLCWKGADQPFSRSHVGLPLHGWSSDPLHSDVSIPDFTFEEYIEINSKAVNKSWTSNSWRKVYARLQSVKQDKSGFVWRGGHSNTLRNSVLKRLKKVPAKLAPLLAEVAPDGINVDPPPEVNRHMSIYEQCRWAFTFYLPGYHYSASLKYKLACGQTIIFVRDEVRSEEFFYDALKDNENIYFVRSDLSDLWEVMERALRQHVERGGAVGAAAHEVAETYLSQRGIDCYVLLYLSRYYLPLVDRTWEAWERRSGSRRPGPGMPEVEVGDPPFATPHPGFDMRYVNYFCHIP